MKRPKENIANDTRVAYIAEVSHRLAANGCAGDMGTIASYLIEYGIGNRIREAYEREAVETAIKLLLMVIAPERLDVLTREVAGLMVNLQVCDMPGHHPIPDVKTIADEIARNREP